MTATIKAIARGMASRINSSLGGTLIDSNALKHITAIPIDVQTLVNKRFTTTAINMKTILTRASMEVTQFCFWANISLVTLCESNIYQKLASS